MAATVVSGSHSLGPVVRFGSLSTRELLALGSSQLLHYTCRIHCLRHQQRRRRQNKKLVLSLVAALPFDLSPPPIDHDFIDEIVVAEAKVSEDGIIESFDNDDEALDAFDNGIAVVDLSHFGRMRVSGDDRIQFLHNQTSANFECLTEGQGCDTVYVTATARTVDIAHAWKNAVILLVSPTTYGSIVEMLNKYIVLANKVEIQDITRQTCLFVLAGPRSNQLMKNLNLADLVGRPYGTHRHYRVNGLPITVAVGNLISEEGFSMVMPPAAAKSVWKTLLSEGAVPR